MRVFVLCLFFVGVSTSVFAATVNFSWLPNQDMATGYNLHYGLEPGVYIMIQDAGFPDPVDGRINGSMINVPESQTVYFAATAYDDSGEEVLESDYSTEVSTFIPVTVPVKPGTPQDVQIIKISGE